jgi:hypothetical protein
MDRELHGACANCQESFHSQAKASLSPASQIGLGKMAAQKERALQRSPLPHIGGQAKL